MMTTLKTQLAGLREQYQLKEQLQSMQDVYEQYRAIRDRLQDVAEPLQKVCAQLKVLKTLPELQEQLDFQENAATFFGIRAELQALTANFKSSGERIEQNGLGELLVRLSGVHDRISEKVVQAWTAFVAELEARAVLAPVFLEQQKTLGNTMTYTNYRNALDNFNRQKTSAPDSQAVVKKLQGYCDEMVELKKGMEFNAPDDVLRFFDALDKQHQASLALLTPEVLSWLKEKALLQSFNVTRKRMM
ncbi:protein DpdI [Pectobacterium brasiliense]|uniref:protein DpdI n=1 Tax=Pectobacterium brasiliense TaxID=180957 RepID=UPI001F0857A6|nr:protein DpdI [Pectobacterium brasiliense]